jgi:uncharacterized membrane protein (GlpM family)
MVFVVKTIVAAALISFCSWLSSKKPELAGFLIALPITSVIALFFSYAEFQDSAKSVSFAKGIFVGIPVSLLFFVPFLLAEKLNLNFVASFVSGLVLLSAGYFAHKYIVSLL